MEGKAGERRLGNRKQGIASLVGKCSSHTLDDSKQQKEYKGCKKKRGGGEAQAGEQEKVLHVVVTFRLPRRVASAAPCHN